jgi:hypothetical protein
MKLDSLLTTENQLKWKKDLKESPETVKLLEKKQMEMLQDIEMGKDLWI